MASTAILNYVSHATYPESEAISSSAISSDDLDSLLSSLRAEQESTRGEIRALSKSTAGDIDSWIAQAKALQADILRSRETARQIVADAEAGETLQADVEEKARKVTLLQREVEFNETLSGTLEHIKYANGLVDRTQESAVTADIETSMRSLEDAESSILGLNSLGGPTGSSRVVEILNQRKEELKTSLIETTTEIWNALISVDHAGKNISIQIAGMPLASPNRTKDMLTLAHLVPGAQALGVLPTLTGKLANDIELVILRPRMLVDDGMVAKITIKKSDVSASGINHDLSSGALFKDIGAIVVFFATHLPQSVTIPMSAILVPSVTELLQQRWLDPAIPLAMPEMAAFTTVLENVEGLADLIDSHQWHGSGALRDWVENAPRAWLTKRREAVLGDVRNLVFSSSRERKQVERVETRVVSQNDPVIAGTNDGAGEDAWEEEWDDAETNSAAARQKSSDAAAAGGDDDDDDDTSAWDVDDDAETKNDGSAGGQEDDDAWGAWDDEEPQKPASPVISKQQDGTPRLNGTSTTPAEQEMTLRETFTVTAVPEGILTTLQQIISDAETLAGSEFSSSPLAPAAQALYTLPTLALAIYRATAPTAYNKIDVGNMLIYNDALRLADLLRSWQSSRPAGAGRLRLDNDATALETFAKRAYASEMESQRTILRDILDGAQGFGNCTVQPFKGECESAVDGTIARLRDVHTLWKDILSQGALLQSLGSLLSTVTGKMISDIEDLGDISETDSHQLNALCQRVTSLTSIFTQPASDGGASQDSRDMTFVYCPTWLKFQYLAEILESSLADIKWMWKEGELSLEFEAEEVVELVQSLFAESDLRRQAVREIKAGRR